VDGILGHNLLLSQAFFGGNPFVDGILGHNLLLSRAFFHNLFFFSRWNSGYQEAFLTNFSLFLRWNSGYQEAFLTNFPFFTMEFWLSGSLSHELFFFHDGILAIMKPFSRTFLFFHDGILAIRKPFSRTFLFFTMEFCKYTIWGKTLFIYISQRVFT
jgi:hypothetical protein